MDSSTGKKLRMGTSACSFCKKRKRKCDGQQPCSTCVRFNNDAHCEYFAEKDKRKWKYDSAYVDHLDVKSDILLQYATELVKNHPDKARGVDLSAVLPSPPELTQSVKTEAIRVHSSALEEIVSTAWRVRRDERGRTEFYGPLSGRQQVVEHDEERPSVLQVNGKDVTFTNPQFRSHLIDLFDVHFASYFYISKLTIHEMRSWGFPNRDPDRQLLLCAVFAYSALYSDHQHTTSAFLAEAEAVALSACRQKLSHTALQGLLVLSCYELGMAHDSVSWLFDAMCASQAQFMGLHLDDMPRDGDPVSFSQVVSMSPVKSALFWSIILQDRIITTVLGRGCRIQYFRIQVPFYSPRLNTLDEDGISESVFALHSKLWYIHDRSMSQIYSFKADYLHNSHRLILLKQGFSSLQVLYNSFPESAKLRPDTTDPRVLMLHLSYYVILILLHRSYLSQNPAAILEVLIQDCDKAAKLVRRFNYLYGFEKAPYFAGYLIFQCAMHDLFFMANQDENIKQGAGERMAVHVRGLLGFGKVWRRGHKDITVLSLLADKWNVQFPLLKEAEILTRVQDESGTPVSMDDIHDNIDKLDQTFQPFYQTSSEPFSMEESEMELPHLPEFMDTFNFNFNFSDATENGNPAPSGPWTQF